VGEQIAATMWRRKDTHRDNPVTMEERKSLMGEQATAAIGTELQLSRIDRLESRRSLIDTDNCRLATPFWLCYRTTLTTVD
jgi:hypothetical protein